MVWSGQGVGALHEPSLDSIRAVDAANFGEYAVILSHHVARDALEHVDFLAQRFLKMFASMAVPLEREDSTPCSDLPTPSASTSTAASRDSMRSSCRGHSILMASVFKFRFRF